MSNPRPAALLMGALVLLLVIELLRRRQMREKYAALWLVIGSVAVVIAIFPDLLTVVTRLLGFAIPANLLFFGGSLVLMAISVQLSLELGFLEEKSRRLAEEVALLRLDLDRLTAESLSGGACNNQGGVVRATCASSSEELSEET
jgi:hypothetical protein